MLNDGTFEYEIFDSDDIDVEVTLDTTKLRSFVGDVPPRNVPAMDTVSPTLYPLPPLLGIIEVPIGTPVATS